MYKRECNRNMRVVRENRSLKCELISLSDCLCAKLLVSIVFSLTLTWLSVSSVSFLASTNVRTICVVTVRINMANMAAIATLIDICEQKWIAKRLLDTETNIKFLSNWNNSYLLIIDHFVTFGCIQGLTSLLVKLLSKLFNHADNNICSHWLLCNFWMYLLE